MNDQSTYNLPPFPIPNRDAIRVFSARIEEITRDRNTTFVTISYRDCIECVRPEDLVRLVVDKNTIIHDDRGRNIHADELERGMTVDASFSPAMTRSIPPQAQAFLIRVVRRQTSNETTTGRIAEINTHGNYIVTISNLNPSSAIRFNLSPETVIRNSSGRRIPLALLVPGLMVRIEHASFYDCKHPSPDNCFYHTDFAVT